MDDRTFEFSAELWLYEGKDAWHFVTLPEDLSDLIEERFGSAARGFGSLRVAVAVGGTEWSTSIFPSKSAASYVLPVKAAVRSAEDISTGDEVAVRLTVKG